MQPEPPGAPAVQFPDDAVVVDVREQDEWDAGRAPGALHIPLSELPERLADLPEDELLVVCRSGGRSARATAWLTHNGYDARNLDGGMKAWSVAGLPLTAGTDGEPQIL